jgi:DNA-binding NtrC family response regulator
VDRLGRVPTRFSTEALDALQEYPWPGTVRELKGAVEHGALMSRTDAVARADLPAYLLERGTTGWPFAREKRPTLSEVERLYIERVLEEVGGNQTRAAEILGISRKSLWERRRRFDLK